MIVWWIRGMIVWWIRGIWREREVLNGIGWMNGLGSPWMTGNLV